MTMRPFSGRTLLRRRRSAAVGVVLSALTVLLGMAVTSCASATVGTGDDRPSRDTAAVVAAAYDKTMEAPTVRMSVSQRMTVPVDGRNLQISATGEGVLTLDGRMVRMTGSFTADGRPGALEFETIMLDGIQYVRYADPEKVRLPAGKSWIRIDLNALLSNELGAGIGDLSGPSGNDPRQGLAYLRGLTGEPREVGVEDVRGVRSTRYSVIVDVKKAAAQHSTAGQAAIDRLATTMGSQSVPMDVWIDPTGRISQMAYTVSLKSTTDGGQGLPTTVGCTYGFLDYGVPIGEITPPPADQVEEFTDRLQAGQPT